MQLKLLLSSLLVIIISVYCSHHHHHHQQQQQHHGRQERIRSLSDIISQPNVRESYFRANKMYTFKYDGQINIGVPDHSEQHSASRIQADITLVKRSDDHFIFRIRNGRIGKQLSRIADPQQIQPMDQFEQSQIDSRQMTILELPVEFTYADGQIQDLVLQQEEEEWSANMKRGVISMLQIKLQPKDRVTMEEEQSALNKLDTESKTDVAQIYRVTEKTVQGKCDTMYSVNTVQNDQDQSSSTMIVTKTIDLNSCQRKPRIFSNFHFSQFCPTCSVQSSDNKSMQSSTVLRYQIRGKRDKFLVESVHMSNDHVLSPQNNDENSVVVTIRASLRLVHSQEASQQSTEMSDFPQTGQKVSDLIYSTETEQQLIQFQKYGDQYFPYQLEQQMFGEQSKVNAFGQVLLKMIRHMRSTVDEKAGSSFTKAVSLARLMKESEIKTIHQQYFSRHSSSQITAEEREKIRNILPHIYAQAATFNTIKHLCEKISTGEISSIKATMLMPTLMNAAHVSKETIDEMLRLEQSSVIQQNPMLKKSIWLVIGSMMQTACSKQSSSSSSSSSSYSSSSSPSTTSSSSSSSSQWEESCTSETEQRFVRIISERLQNSNKWEDKVLFLRVFGNAGLESSIEPIESILFNKEQSQQSSAIRMEAILALRNLRNSLPQKTKSILLATALNKMESSAVRMAAIQQLFEENPGKLIIDQLVSMVNQCSNRRVASFTYWLMKSLSESKQPCYAEMNSNLRSAIKKVKRISANSMPVSDVMFESMQDMEKKLGMDVFLLPFYDSDEIVPKFIRAGINEMSNNRRTKNLLAVEMGSSGLSSIIADLLETTVPERQAGSMQYSLNWRKLTDKIHGSPWKSSEPKSWMSLKYKNQDVLLYTLNEQQLQRMFEKSGAQMLTSMMSALRDISRSYSIDEATLLYETTDRMPTAIGSQLEIRNKMPAMFSFHGQIGGSIQGRLEVQGKVNAIVSMVTMVSSRTPIFVNGIYLIRTAKASLPVDAVISVDPSVQSEQQLSVQFKHSQSGRDLIRFESRPVIYTKRSMQPHAESEEKTIVADKNTRMQSFKQCLQVPLIGSEACVRGLISKPSCAHSKLLHYVDPWFGPNKVVFSVYSTSSNENQITSLFGSARSTASGQGDQDVSYTLTVGNSKLYKQSWRVEMSKYSGESIVPKQIRATYTQSFGGQQQSEVCMQVDMDRKGGYEQESNTPQKMKINAKLNWGRQCQPDNYIQATIDTSVKQRMYREQSRPMTLLGDQSSSAYLTWRDEMSALSIQISHSNLPQYFAEYGQKVLDMAVYSNYWSSETKKTEIAESSSSSLKYGRNTIQITMNSNGKADVKIQTSTKTFLLENVRIPAAFRYESLQRSNLIRLSNILISNQGKASCSIRENTMRTFDGAIYRIPFGECYTILAKDEASRFTVMAKQSKSQSDKKTIKIITTDHEIKLKPEHGSTSIYLDGSKWQDTTFTDQRSIKISQSGQQVSVKLIKQNVEISSNGDRITIQVPEKNHGLQKGMCGNFNADSSDEFGEFHRDQRRNIMQMWQQMTLTDGSCQQTVEQSEMEFEYPMPFDQYDDYDSSSQQQQQQQQQQIWGRGESSFDSSDSTEWSSSKQWGSSGQQGGESKQLSDSLEIEDVLTTVTPNRQNKVIERNGQPCISIRPIERCPEQSYIAESSQTEQEVQYTCIGRQDPLMSQISHRQRHSISIDLSNRDVTFSRREIVPRKCVTIV